MRIVFSLLLALLLAAPAPAQTAREEILADPFKGGGVYNMYPEAPVTPGRAPKGFKPFYISHFGRHGARYNHGGYEVVLARFETAAKDGKLTPAGEAFRERYRRMYPAMRDRGGDLSFKGQAQQTGIAHRMATRYPEVFRDRPRIEAVSSTVQRCILTMGAFCLQMARERPGLEIRMDQSNAYMSYMSAQSDYNPDYAVAKKARKGRAAEAYARDLGSLVSRIDPESFLSRLFTDTAYAAKLADGDPGDFMSDLYYLAASTQSVDFEEDFHDLFTPEEWYDFWAADNFQFYAHFGPAPYFGGLQWATASTLLGTILDEADRDIPEGTVGARCRFGHDVGLMALLTLLQAEGFATAGETPDAVGDCWRSYRFPMSVNMQWIFYRNRKGEVLVRCLLNEEEDLVFPVRPAVVRDGAPYYRWEDLSRHGRERMAAAAALIAAAAGEEAADGK